MAVRIALSGADSGRSDRTVRHLLDGGGVRAGGTPDFVIEPVPQVGQHTLEVWVVDLIGQEVAGSRASATFTAVGEPPPTAVRSTDDSGGLPGFCLLVLLPALIAAGLLTARRWRPPH